MQEPGGMWGEARLGLPEAPAEHKSPQNLPLAPPQNTSCSGGAAKPQQQGEGVGLAACCFEVSTTSQRLLLEISVFG